MTTIRGTLRSLELREAEGAGATLPDARAAALAGLDLAGFELVQANATSSKATGETTIRAVARSRETRQHEASGATYADALQAYRDTIPNGWQSQAVTVED